MSLKVVYIVELRKGWLSQRVLGTFDDIKEANRFEREWRRENWEYLQCNCDSRLEISVAKEAA